MTAADLPRRVYNRHVLLLKPKQPFLDWLAAADPAPLPLTLEQVQEDRTAYLIPEFDETGDAEKWVMKLWRWFFEEEIGGWLTDPDLWPEKMSPQVFKQFFDIEIHSLVFDVSGKPLTVEDWSDDGGEG
jgi:hypothetical protein